MYNHCCHGKAPSIAYSECATVFSPKSSSMQVVSSLHSVILSYVACLALQHTFQKKNFECKMCVLIFITTFVWNISHSEKNSVR